MGSQLMNDWLNWHKTDRQRKREREREERAVWCSSKAASRRKTQRLKRHTCRPPNWLWCLWPHTHTHTHTHSSTATNHQLPSRQPGPHIFLSITEAAPICLQLRAGSIWLEGHLYLPRQAHSESGCQYQTLQRPPIFGEKKIPTT